MTNLSIKLLNIEENFYFEELKVKEYLRDKTGRKSTF